MSKHTQTVECDRCKGLGILWETIVEDSVTTRRSHSCPSCLGQAHVDVDLPTDSPLLDALLSVLPAMSYMGRKGLERTIADHLFKGDVVNRAALEQVMKRIQELNAAEAP